MLVLVLLCTGHAFWDKFPHRHRALAKNSRACSALLGQRVKGELVSQQSLACILLCYKTSVLLWHLGYRCLIFGIFKFPCKLCLGIYCPLTFHYV